MKFVARIEYDSHDLNGAVDIAKGFAGMRAGSKLLGVEQGSQKTLPMEEYIAKYGSSDGGRR